MAPIPQQVQRAGFGCSSDTRKSQNVSVSHRPTATSGIRKRVKRKNTSAVASTSAESNPPSLPKAQRPNPYVERGAAITPSMSGKRVLVSRTPKGEEMVARGEDGAGDVAIMELRGNST